MKKRLPPLTLELVTKRLRVDLTSGRCYWLQTSKFHPNIVGKEAGGIGGRKTHRYCLIYINGALYKRSHIVFLVATGSWPTKWIDHADGNTLNDHPSNLREASPSQNSCNCVRRPSKYGTPRGIRLTREGNYQVQIGCNNQKFCFGTYPTLEEARAVYLEKRRELHGAFCGR